MGTALKPGIYAAWIPKGAECLRLSVYAVCIPGSQKANADTFRRTGMPSPAAADAARRIARDCIFLSDTCRETVQPQCAFLRPSVHVSMVPKGAEILRPAMFAAMHPLLRGRGTARAGAGRKVVRFISVAADTKRSILRTCAATADIRRALGRRKAAAMDALRRIRNRQRAIADTSMRIPRVLEYVHRASPEQGGENSHGASGGNAAGSQDAPVPQHAAASQVPSIMQNFHGHGIRSFSMTLGELTLSDTFQLETVQPMNIDDAVQGQILDYRFHFLVEETSQRDMVQTVKGMYSKDRLLYTPINVFVVQASVFYYADQIANALGLKLHMACDDFIPSQNYEGSGMTYQDFISSLFGWTSKLPQRQVNVFIRGDTLHIVQRGMEESVVDITDWPHSRPTVDRKLVRSIWNSGNNEDGDGCARSDEDDEPVPFTGTISLGEISRTYVDGFLVRETNKDGDTEYSYDGEYLAEKRTSNKDGSESETRYFYARTDRDVYLFKEEERTTEPDSGGKGSSQKSWTDWGSEDGTERITYHAPLGYGWYATTVYVDGTLEGSSLSQGKPGSKASRFTIDQSNLSLGSRYTSYYDEDHAVPVFTSLIDTEFPVKGEEYLWTLTQAIEWLNRKTQETVTVEIHANIHDGVPDAAHIVDFTERIRFEGNEYFLQSNAVELTPRSLKQTIKMTRWYQN